MRINTQIEEKLSITNKEIEHLESFTYLGRIVTQDEEKDQDINQTIKKANAAFIQLYQVWKNKNCSQKTKLWIFNSNVKSGLLYACETWRVLKASMNKLQSFVNRCLRRILNIRGQTQYQITLCGRSQNKNQLTSKLKGENGDGLGTF
jgi:hypothetical protein